MNSQTLTNTAATVLARPDRLAYHATSYDEVYQYFLMRNLQLAPHGFRWSFELTPQEGGYTTHLTSQDGTTYDSFYVTNQGKGVGRRLLKQCHNKIITIGDCQIVEWLRHHDANFEVIHGVFDTVEYQMIQRTYGNERAKRSGVFKMNHIDEGIYILSKLGASSIAQKAFCLHPLLQLDPDLEKNFDVIVAQCDKRAVALAMEYRNIANAYLSRREIDTLEEVALSPLEGVNRMLVADKIQNYKDFMAHHYETHPRRRELNEYFHNWFERLGEDRMGNLHWVDWIASLESLHTK